jgi:hypothetical protein
MAKIMVAFLNFVNAPQNGPQVADKALNCTVKQQQFQTA